MKYKVLSKAVTVLRRTDKVIAQLEAGLEKEQTLADVLPDAWTQGVWTNWVAKENEILDNTPDKDGKTEYEPTRLAVLAQGDSFTACLQLIKNDKTK